MRERRRKTRASRGIEEEYRKCKECAIINATQRVDPFAPKIFEKP